MYASASTWLFNVVQQILTAKQIGFQTHFVSGAVNIAGWDQSFTHVVKSHEISDDSAIQTLITRADTIFITVRDPRDAVASMVLYQKASFDQAFSHVCESADLCLSLAEHERAIVLRYEAGFFDDPATVDQIAARLQTPLPEMVRNKIFTATRRSEIENFIAALPRLPGVLQDRASGDLLDPKTHWHSHHAGRSGEAGRWRHILNPAEVKLIEQRLPGLL